MDFPLLATATSPTSSSSSSSLCRKCCGHPRFVGDRTFSASFSLITCPRTYEINAFLPLIPPAAINLPATIKLFTGRRPFLTVVK